MGNLIKLPTSLERINSITTYFYFYFVQMINDIYLYEIDLEKFGK